MATDREPSIRAVWLGQELRKIRESRKISLRELSGYIGKIYTSLSRIETGHFPVREDEVIAYLDICGVKDPHKRTDLLTMCRDVGQRGWWDGYDGDVAGTLMDRLWIEAQAETIRSFEATSIPGLLQTPEYASAMMRIGSTRLSERAVARRVEVRMTRQHVLLRHHPARFDSLIDETVLHRLPGDDDLKRGQLDHLVEMSQRDNIGLRIIPASVPGTDGPFEIIKLASPYPTVGYLATSVGDICVEGGQVVDLAQTYDRLLEASLDVQTSQEVIIAERIKL